MKDIQKNLIINILKNDEHKAYSADEIEKELPSISKATLYRYLDNLCLIKMVRKIYNNQTNKYEYQYVFEGCSSHLHMKCKMCGVVIHLDCKITKDYLEHIAEEHAFIIDNYMSTIYGLCNSCKERNI